MLWTAYESLLRNEALLSDLLGLFPPEFAHRTAVRSAQALKVLPKKKTNLRLQVEAFGLPFSNPVGLAAGFDKSAEAVEGLCRLGFSFLEVGTVTPLPQKGNPKPRLFRLQEDQAVINRMGFNNDGYAQVRSRLLSASRCGIVGVNIGPNKDSSDRIADYVLGLRTFCDVADYFAMNISSPNTPGLRDFHGQGELEKLLTSTLSARDLMASRRPVLLKIAPDLDQAALEVVLSMALNYKIDGLIVSNTTLGRDPSLFSRNAREAGGLSGRPLYSMSTRMVARCFLRCGDRIPIVGVGGIDSFEKALEKIEAGARLIQIYTGLIYQGPGLISKITKGLAKHLQLKNLKSVSDLIGCRAGQIAENQS